MPGTDQQLASTALLRPDPGSLPGPEPGGLPRPGTDRPPRVSIGTIEVTVLAPAPPASHAVPPPLARSPIERPSARAADAGGRRLQDGLRRWYGTAQG